MFIPEVMLSAPPCIAALELLRRFLKGRRKIAVKWNSYGPVAGDIPDIGKSLWRMMFVAGGFEVIDLGINVAPQAFVEAVNKHEPDVVGMSALLTSTMPAMAETIEAIDNAGMRKDSRLKVIVGGAPITADYAEQIGADLYGENAIEAVEVVKKALAK